MIRRMYAFLMETTVTSAPMNVGWMPLVEGTLIRFKCYDGNDVRTPSVANGEEIALKKRRDYLRPALRWLRSTAQNRIETPTAQLARLRSVTNYFQTGCREKSWKKRGTLDTIEMWVLWRYNTAPLNTILGRKPANHNAQVFNTRN